MFLNYVYSKYRFYFGLLLFIAWVRTIKGLHKDFRSVRSGDRSMTWTVKIREQYMRLVSIIIIVTVCIQSSLVSTPLW